MSKFYKTTKYLWIISRVILIVLFGVTVINRISETRTSDLIVTSFFLLLIILMIMISTFEFSKKQPHFSLQFVVGISNVLLGFLMSYLFLTLVEKDYAIHVQIGFQFLPLWLILYGAFEINNGINFIKNSKID